MCTSSIHLHSGMVSNVAREGSKNIVPQGRIRDRIEIEVSENGNQGDFRKNRAAGG
jgi:hypothetical protein